MTILKVFSLLSLLAGVVIAAYLYVTDVNKSTQVPSTNGSSSQQSGTAPIDAAGGAVNNFNQQSQQRLQQAQSQYNQ
jgi:hypothetical protein